MTQMQPQLPMMSMMVSNQQRKINQANGYGGVQIVNRDGVNRMGMSGDMGYGGSSSSWLGTDIRERIEKSRSDMNISNTT